MMSLSAAIGFGMMSLAISISPGASWAYIISTTASRGIRAGLLAVCGNATGILAHGFVAAIGLMTLLTWTSETTFQVLRCAGAVYLIFLAIRTLLQRPENSEVVAPVSAAEKRRIFRDGFFVNLLNPKVMFLMIALLPQFLAPEKGLIAVQVILFGIMHACIASSVLTSLAILTDRVSKMTMPGGRFRNILRVGSAIVLMVFSLQLLIGG